MTITPSYKHNYTPVPIVHELQVDPLYLQDKEVYDQVWRARNEALETASHLRESHYTFKAIVNLDEEETNKLSSQPALTNIEVVNEYTTLVNPDTKV